MLASGILQVYERHYNFRELTMYKSEKKFVDEVINMGEYNDSLMFNLYAVDTVTKETIDLIDNDYFELRAYLKDESTPYKYHPDVQFVRCPEEQKLSKSMKNLVCIGNRNKIDLRANWQVSSYNILTFNIYACKNSTENKNRCKPPEEIQAMRKNVELLFNTKKAMVDS